MAIYLNGGELALEHVIVAGNFATHSDAISRDCREIVDRTHGYSLIGTGFGTILSFRHQWRELPIER